MYASAHIDVHLLICVGSCASLLHLTKDNKQRTQLNNDNPSEVQFS